MPVPDGIGLNKAQLTYGPVVRNLAVCIRFYFAGAEVDPFIPSEVWAYAYGGTPFSGTIGKAKTVFFKEETAFAPLDSERVLLRRYQGQSYIRQRKTPRAICREGLRD